MPQLWRKWSLRTNVKNSETDQSERKWHFQRKQQHRAENGMSRINLIDQANNQSEDSTEDDAEKCK